MYIATRKATRSPAGEFVQEAKADHEMPDAKTWDELTGYLTRKNVREAGD